MGQSTTVSLYIHGANALFPPFDYLSLVKNKLDRFPSVCGVIELGIVQKPTGVVDHRSRTRSGLVAGTFNQVFVFQSRRCRDGVCGGSTDSDAGGGVAITVGTGVALRLAVEVRVVVGGAFVAIVIGLSVSTGKLQVALSSRPHPVVNPVPMTGTAAAAIVATNAMATGTTGKLRFTMGSTSDWR